MLAQPSHVASLASKKRSSTSRGAPQSTKRPPAEMLAVSSSMAEASSGQLVQSITTAEASFAHTKVAIESDSATASTSTCLESARAIAETRSFSDEATSTNRP